MPAIPTRTEERDEEATAEVKKCDSRVFQRDEPSSNEFDSEVITLSPGVKFLCNSPTLKHITGVKQFSGDARRPESSGKV